MHPDGEYCEHYHLELRFGYKMYHKLMELIGRDEKYSDQVDKIWDEQRNKIFGK